MSIKNFYPTPPNLIAKMVSKIKGHSQKALEPSADRPEFSAFKVNLDLQALLRGKGVKGCSIYEFTILG